jgi:hypothetical protein
MEEIEVCYKILTDLSESKYRDLAEKISDTPEEQLTLSFIENKLEIHERIIRNRRAEKPKYEQKEANHTGTKKQFQKNGNQPLRRCFKCGYTNHIAKDCKAPQSRIDQYRKESEKESHQQEKYKGNKKLPRKNKDHEDDKEYAGNTTPKGEGSDLEVKESWYLDSGTTAHMTNNLCDLVNIEEINPTQILGSIKCPNSTTTTKGEAKLTSPWS